MRPLYRETEGTQIGKINRRVDSLERRRPVSGFYEIKLFADDETVTVGDGRFIFAIPFDLNQAKLKYVNAYVSTVSSSGLVTVQIHNLDRAPSPTPYDMLTIPITIDAGEKDSETALTDWEIAGREPPPGGPSYAVYGFPYSDNTVFARQQIRIDVVTAGTGAMGLGINLGFD